MAGSITAPLADARASLAVYKAAGSSIQLQKAAQNLQTHISQLTGSQRGPAQKLAANFFIEAFSAAFGSLQVQKCAGCILQEGHSLQDHRRGRFLFPRYP